MKFESKATFPFSAETVWTASFDPKLGEAVDAETGITAQVLEDRDTADGHYRKSRVIPDAKLPPFAAKAVGAERFTYVMETTWTRDKLGVRWTVLPDVLADRITAKGTVTYKDRAEGECERIVNGDISVAIPLLGGKIEEQVVAQMRQSFERAVSVTRRWLEAKVEA